VQEDPPQPTLARLDLLLVRHAEALPPGTPGWEERDDERPLSEDGLRQADDLALELDPYGLSAIYSSPYTRALQTVEPIARRRQMSVQVLADLRERRLTEASRDDWPDVLARAWTDPDYALPGTESGRAAQRRGIGVLDLLRVRHADGGRLLVGSHGNLISLILQTFEPGVDLDFHLAMPVPAIYHLEHDGLGWRVMGGHGFVEIAQTN
jgi:2,3-bisphosphoglycerate-dependent phosphoglycerate mutase